MVLRVGKVGSGIKKSCPSGEPLRNKGQTEARSACARDGRNVGNCVILAIHDALTVGKIEAVLDTRVDIVDSGALVVHAAHLR